MPCLANRQKGRWRADPGLVADGGRLEPDDRSDDHGLPPLRWVPEEELVTLHRPECLLVREPHATAQALAGGAALERVWAPRICECRRRLDGAPLSSLADALAGGASG